MKWDRLSQGVFWVSKDGKSRVLSSLWDLGAISPQHERKHYICNQHPTKMRPALARAILQLYGESPVLDPMAGVGTTLVEAMLLGMDATGVELEQKFAEEANRNIVAVAKNLSPPGKGACIKGDARDLSCLDPELEFGSIVSSPPYLTSLAFNDANFLHADAKHKAYPHIGVYKRRPPSAVDYSSQENLGKKDGLAHLNEMAKVYGHCFRVLKPGKFMVLVVKDVRRKGVTVPLAADTIKLCQSVGFEVFDVVVNKIHFPSFWLLYNARKMQERGIPVALKNYEYVLCFRKPSN